MGSGEGQTRRMQATAPTVGVLNKVLALDPDKWEEFVNESGIEHVSAYKYYLGTLPGKCGAAEHEKVTTELFADAISVGALILPPPYIAADFEFKMVPGSINKLNIILKQQPELSEKLGHVSYYMGKASQMQDANNEAIYFLSQLVRALDLLFAMEENERTRDSMRTAIVDAWAVTQKQIEAEGGETMESLYRRYK